MTAGGRVGALLIVVAFAVMAESLVYAARFGPGARPLLLWTVPGAVVVFAVGGLLVLAVRRAEGRRDEE